MSDPERLARIKSKMRMEWRGNDLVILYYNMVIAKRHGRKWTTSLPIAVTDEPSGRVRVKVLGRIGREQMIMACKSKKEVDRLMKNWGWVQMPPASIGEMYDDAVRRGDDPKEIAWLREQWMSGQKGTAQ